MNRLLSKSPHPYPLSQWERGTKGVRAIVLFFSFFIFTLGFLVNFAWATSLESGVSPAVEKENNPELTEVYRIKIENSAGGTIEVSQDRGISWKPVGKVLYPTEKVNSAGYAAAKWVNAGEVAAAAVNAIHIKTEPAGTDRTIFSLLPKEFILPPQKYRSFLSLDSSIYTNISGGKSIFGGGYSPFVGNKVLVARDGAGEARLSKGYKPKLGDTLYILVERPKDFPKEIVFENRFGGRIFIDYFSGEMKVIGEVLRPVVGIGRFEGSAFLDPGRVRANHAGVIDVSLSPRGGVGGFQIVPALHGQDMGYVRKMTQWMVIGPKDAADLSLEGVAPFFRYYLHPSYNPDDLDAENWEERLLSRFLVEVKYDGENVWKPMPIYSLRRDEPLPEWANTALDKVSQFRILFPVEMDQ